MAEIFSDDYEDGNLDAWTGRATDGGDLSAHADAAIHGSFGAKYVIDDTKSIYSWIFFTATKRFRARFYFDPNSITMANNDLFYLMTGIGGGSGRFIMNFKKVGDDYQINLGVKKDAGTYSWAGLVTVSDEPHCIEVDWKASSGAGSNDGFVKGYIDEVETHSVTSVDNDTFSVDEIDVGMTIFSASGTSGIVYLDDFVCNNDGTEIGEISEESATNVLFIFQNF